MERFELRAKKREGKVADGYISAVVYGGGIKNTSLQVLEKDFNKLYIEAGESSLIDLNLGKKLETVLIHEVQRDSVSGKIIHIDFLGVNMKKKIKAEIPIVFEGVASAVSERGGIFNRSLDSLEVESFPGDLPHEIKVDISVLKEIGDHIIVGDIKLNDKNKILNDNDQIIASVVEQKIKEEEDKKDEKEFGEEGEELGDVDTVDANSGDSSDSQSRGESVGSGEEN